MASWAVGVATAGLILVGWLTLPVDRWVADSEDSTHAEADGMQPRARPGGPGVDLTQLGVVHGARRVRPIDYASLWGHDHGEPSASSSSTRVSRGDLKLLGLALETRSKTTPTVQRVAVPAQPTDDPAQALAIVDGINRLLALVTHPAPTAISSAAPRPTSTVLHSRPIPKARVLQAL